MKLALVFSTLCLAAGKKPHIVFFLADDFGWGNLGYHRRDTGDSPEELQGKAEVHTPTLDRLIDEGILLSRHYGFKTCSPSRSALQTGRLAVHVNIEQDVMLSTANYEDPMSGYSGIPRNMTGIAEKLRSAGYRTHMVGKWDVGMATPDHTPKGRGYETWYGYYGHANHYWHMLPDPTYAVVDECLNQVRDLSMHNASYTGPVRDAISLSAACADPESDRGCYEEHLFKERVLEIIREHKVEEPLFLVYAFHLVHVPLQVPKIWLHEIDHAVKAAGGLPFDSENRRLYAAMTLYMDYAIGKVVEALKNKGMYEDTLVIFASDNGGSIDAYSGGSNYPLRGGKVSDWEGGLRTNAFVSGGFVPESRRGTKFEGVINIADWYGTLTELAGVEMKDHRAEAANVWLKEQGLPLLYPVESVPQWQNILQNRNGRPWPIHLSTYAVMMWPYKLVIAQQPVAAWTGPVYPNCSTLESVQMLRFKLCMFERVTLSYGQHGPKMKLDHSALPTVMDSERLVDCSGSDPIPLLMGREGCLMNVRDDPTEHRNLAGDPEYASTFEYMRTTLSRMNEDVFYPDRGKPRVEACDVAIEHGKLGGFFQCSATLTPLIRPPSLQVFQSVPE
ncbi:Arsb [Symbiodinium natans]|uniref:Arsb protein n=1 Tax=Symbiodinium natans TaxID=878477 RepID=A0A812IJ02_9DINO|nr:Arsb [Symbiodinium natans]